MNKPETSYDLHPLFRLDGKTALVTGGGGVLCGEMSKALSAAGAHVVVLDRDPVKAEQVADAICQAGGQCIGLRADVLDKDSLEQVREKVVQTFGHIDILINGAGGNQAGAQTSADVSFFDLELGPVERVFGVNFMGTFLASQVFGKVMAEQKSGVILNIASMNSFRPLTRVVAYSAAKAAVVNFTQWLAVYMAQGFGPEIRVNALAPGFFLTEQNHALLIDATSGESTPRGKAILAHTPMNRLGSPSDLLGAMLWLVSPASAFVTGVVVPIDGGFNAFSGV